jgi:YesN/AraC family two-component response regulator
MATPEELLKQQAETEAKLGVTAAPIKEEVVLPVEPVTPALDASAEEKGRFQKRIDQLTAARRAAEERARLAEERVARLDTERLPTRETVLPGKETRMVGQYTKEQWLEWHDEDPLAATEYVSEMKAEAKAQHFINQMAATTNRAETINSVYKAHPELKEVMDGSKTADEVPFYQIYDEVAREMPEAQNMARGPLLVMREAERRVRDREIENKEKKIASDAALEENNRQSRVGAGYTLGSKSTGPTGISAKLTPEEDRIARKMGMTPEEYAKNKRVK